MSSVEGEVEAVPDPAPAVDTPAVEEAPAPMTAEEAPVEDPVDPSAPTDPQVEVTVTPSPAVEAPAPEVPVFVTDEQRQLYELQQGADQLSRQILALNEQLRQASGYQQEAIASRETIKDLTFSNDGLSEQLTSARNEISGYRSQVEMLTNQASGDTSLVAAAQNLAGALKTLLK